MRPRSAFRTGAARCVVGGAVRTSPPVWIGPSTIGVRTGLPTIYNRRGFVEVGGRMGYGASNRAARARPDPFAGRHRCRGAATRAYAGPPAAPAFAGEWNP